ncbi:MAG TPA: hypothetical protein VGE02_10210 [Gemmatimonadales bacterium]
MGLQGLEPAAGADLARRAAALKHLTSLPLQVGVAVHNAAHELVAAIRGRRRRPDYEDLLVSARYTLNQVWRSSQPDLIERFWSLPGVHPALRELVYGGTLREFEIEEARWRLQRCLANLCDAPVLDDLEEASRDDIRLEFPGPESFTLGPGLTVWVALDLAYRHVDPRSHDRLVDGPTWCVTDFKTGRTIYEDDERLQLAGYGLWLREMGYPATDGAYLGRIIDLVRGCDRWYRLGPEELAAAEAVIVADTARQHALMVDPTRVLPRPMADWALAHPASGACRRCNFLELCLPELSRAYGPLGRRLSPLRTACVRQEAAE